MAAIEAVLFDLGHTLVDVEFTDDALQAIYRKMRDYLVSDGIRSLPSANELARAVSGRIGALIVESYEQQRLEELEMVDLLTSCFRSIGFELSKDTIEQCVEIEHEILSRAYRLEDETRQVLARLRAANLKLGIVSNITNPPRLMRRELERLDIASYFDVAIFSSEVGVRKPHPVTYQSALDTLNVSPQHAIFVGDRLREDVHGPQKLGMRAALCQHYRREDVLDPKPDFNFRTFSELESFLLAPDAGNLPAIPARDQNLTE